MATSDTGSIGLQELLEHADWLRRLAGALVRDPDEASDLAQDTMEVALAKPPTKAGPLKPWLAGVARNLARMRLRTSSRRAGREDASASSAPSSSSGPDELVERFEMQRLIANKVSSLEEPFRSTILLRYWLHNYQQRDVPVPMYTRMAMAGPVKVAELRAGPLTTCVVPLPIDPDNPMAMMALRSKMEQLPMKCKTLTIDDGAQHTVVVEVPAEWVTPF